MLVAMAPLSTHACSHGLSFNPCDVTHNRQIGDSQALMDEEDTAWYKAHIRDVLDVVGDDAFAPAHVIGRQYFYPTPEQDAARHLAP